MWRSFFRKVKGAGSRAKASTVTAPVVAGGKSKPCARIPKRSEKSGASGVGGRLDFFSKDGKGKAGRRRRAGLTFPPWRAGDAVGKSCGESSSPLELAVWARIGSYGLELVLIGFGSLVFLKTLSAPKKRNEVLHLLSSRLGSLPSGQNPL